MKNFSNYVSNHRSQYISKPSDKGLIQHIVSKFEKVSLNHQLLFSLYSAPYTGVLKREIALADITGDDIVLNIGCGAMPFTALNIAALTGAKVIAIDNDPDTIQQAKATVDNCNMAHKIEILLADGKNVSGVYFTKAVIALQAAPKKQILHNLLSIAPSGGKLLFRQPRKWCEKQYESLDEGQAEAYTGHLMPTFGKTLLINAQ